MKLRWAFLLFAALFAYSVPAHAQAYPTRPIKIIMPQPPGGIADITLRALAQELSTSLGQPVIIENRPGAAGNIAGQACAQAQPDGYTLCMLSIGTLSLNPFLYKKVSYDVEKDFAPISMLFFIFEGLMVNPSLGVNSLQELIALSKAKPGTLNYVAQASSITVFMETLKKNTGADMQRIPYAGGNEAALAVISGQAPVGFFGIGNLYAQITEGKVKLLAVDSTERSPLFPQTPTLAEAGYHGLTLRPWWGLFAPAGTPKAVIEKIHGEVVRVLRNQDFIDKTLVKRSLRPAPMPLDDFTRFLVQDREQSRKLISDAGLVPE
jgi:tripartite-type tricarboxylate transporter receptor subunit TctC